jgi:hypothetical protein
VLVLGRQDYAVRSVRIDSKAETWNATFSRLYMMGRDSASLRDFFATGAAPKLDQGRPRAGEAARDCTCCLLIVARILCDAGRMCWND